MINRIKDNNRIMLYLTIAIMLFVNSTYSPIRDLSYLNYDSTIFYIIGKGIKYGLTPYIDLIDHKGPYIFLINYLGVLTSEYRHLGIFMVYLLINLIDTKILYKIVDVFSKNDKVKFLTVLSIVILQNTYYFSYGGMKCETFLLPFIHGGEYLCLKGIEEEHFGWKNTFVIGILAGVIIFTKANLILCFVPIVIIMLFDSKMKIGTLLHHFFYGTFGVVVGAAPALLYAIATKTLKEMIYYTFTLNFLYSRDLFFRYSDLAEAFSETFIKYSVIVLLSVVSIYFLYRILKNYKSLLFMYYILVVASTIVAVFLALRPYSYYASPLVICLFPISICAYSFIFGISETERYEEKNLQIKKKKSIPFMIVIFVLMIISYIFSWQATKINNERQYIISKEMKKLQLKDEYKDKDKSTLVVGAILSIYNELDIFPNVHFFATPYIKKDTYSAPYDEIIDSIKNKDNEWLVLSFTPLMIRSGWSQEVRAAVKDRYALVEEDPYLGVEIYIRK